jgi:hypothetical protein
MGRRPSSLHRGRSGAYPGGHPSGYSAPSRFLDGTPALAKPDILASRGKVALADVVGAADAEAYARAVPAWAGSIWAAYAPLHPDARGWIGAAPAGRSSRPAVDRARGDA